MKRTAGDDQQPARRESAADNQQPSPRRRLKRADSSSASDASPARKSKSKSRSEIERPPRTVEILWDGRVAPGFTLKRKRGGAIQVSTVAAATASATKLRVGSELRLVGGFPVARLTLKAVKKVMLCAPKPVSLVFVNADELDVLYSDSAASEDEAEAEADARLRKNSTVSVASSEASDASMASTSASSRSRSVASVSEASDERRQHRRHPRERESESTYAERSADHTSKKRKVSRLQVALDRVNQLLNRPVRQSGLNIPANQSIVV
jgi:hypothetical protein